MPVTTKVTELPESRVRLDVEVPSEEIESSLQRSATALGRDSLPEWLEHALLQSGVRTVGDPKLDLQELPERGDPLTFSIEVGVTPKATLGRYKELEVGRREPEVPGEAIDAEIDRLREG